MGMPIILQVFGVKQSNKFQLDDNSGAHQRDYISAAWRELLYFRISCWHRADNSPANWWHWCSPTSLTLLTFGICWPPTIPLRHAAAVGAHGVGAVIGGGHGWSPLAKKNSWRHGLRPCWRLHCPSAELVVCQAAILGIQIVFRWAAVLRDFQGLLHYYCLLFGAFLLLLGFLLLLLLVHCFFVKQYLQE